MSTAGIRGKLVEALQNISPTLKIYPYIPSNPNDNTFMYLRYTNTSHLITFSKTLSRMDFIVSVMTMFPAGTRTEDAIKVLDTYTDSIGQNSVRAAIYAIEDNALLPDASHAHLTGASPARRYMFNGKPYLGVEMPLEVYTV